MDVAGKEKKNLCRTKADRDEIFPKKKINNDNNNNITEYSRFN